MNGLYNYYIRFYISLHVTSYIIFNFSIQP